MTTVTETLPQLINLEKVVVRGEKLLTKALFAATGLFLIHSWTCHQNKELERWSGT